MPGMWEKWPNEEILVGRDWTLDLDGATISGTPPEPAVIVGSGLDMDYAGIDGNVTTYWLRDGTAGITSQVTISVTTSEGEVLVDKPFVVVK